MMRTRFLWFTLGFTSVSALIAQFVARDLLVDRRSISSEIEGKFGSLKGRVSNLETALQDHDQHHQEGGN